MSLQNAILVALADAPQSGYDVAKQFDENVGFFWRARHSQIYRELAKLKDKGWAVSEEIQQSGKPNRIVFSITDDGREALLRWSREPAAVQELKDDVLVQLYGIEDIDLNALRGTLLARQERHRDHLAQYEAKMKVLQTGNTLKDVGRQLALEVALIYEREWSEWCDRALARLAPDAVAQLTNVIPIKELPRSKEA